MQKFRPNKLRELLRKGEPTFSYNILCPWPGMVEIMGAAGTLDYVEFLAPYVGWDFEHLESWTRACEVSGLTAMMRLDQEPRTFLAERAIGHGFQAVNFADIRTVEEAEEAVRAVKMDTPMDGGRNGCSAFRSVGYLWGGMKEASKVTNDTVIDIMIEKKPAVDHLDEILEIKGIDFVQFGPCDYSISIGKHGEEDHPLVREAHMKMIKTAIKKGVRPIVDYPHRSLKFSENEAEKALKKYTDLGVIDFRMGNDANVFYDWVHDNGGAVRKAVERLKK